MARTQHRRYMAHYAKIKDSIVVEIIVADESVINSFDDTSAWIQTSYNTHGGVHSNSETPLRKNYATIGGTYDSTLDAFMAAKPYPSWTLDESTCYWEPPVTRPDSATPHYWKEETRSWVEVNIPE